MSYGLNCNIFRLLQAKKYFNSVGKNVLPLYILEKHLTLKSFTTLQIQNPVAFNNGIKLKSINNYSCTYKKDISSRKSVLFFSTTGCTSKSQIKVKEILCKMKDELELGSIDEAELHAQYILAKILCIDRNDLPLKMDEKLSEDQHAAMDQMIRCSLVRLPLQYILGDWDFHSIKLKTKPPVFIPRPETELLVNFCLKHISDLNDPTVLEIGCGSGAISLALLHNNDRIKRLLAIDQSEYAVGLTSENACDLKLDDRITILKSKLSNEGFSNTFSEEKFDLIVSNPPYILRKDLANLQPEILLYEDLRALDGGSEGLDIIRNICIHGQRLLSNKGAIFLEIDPCHEFLIPDMLLQINSPLSIKSFYKDLNNHCRFVELINSLK